MRVVFFVGFNFLVRSFSIEFLLAAVILPAFSQNNSQSWLFFITAFCSHRNTMLNDNTRAMETLCYSFCVFVCVSVFAPYFFFHLFLFVLHLFVYLFHRMTYTLQCMGICCLDAFIRKSQTHAKKRVEQWRHDNNNKKWIGYYEAWFIWKHVISLVLYFCSHLTECHFQCCSQIDRCLSLKNVFAFFCVYKTHMVCFYFYYYYFSRSFFIITM